MNVKAAKLARRLCRAYSHNNESYQRLKRLYKEAKGDTARAALKNSWQILIDAAV